MRRRYQWALAHLLHLRPCDLDALSVEDLDDAIRYVEAVNKQRREGA